MTKFVLLCHFYFFFNISFNFVNPLLAFMANKLEFLLVIVTAVTINFLRFFLVYATFIFNWEINQNCLWYFPLFICYHISLIFLFWYINNYIFIFFTFLHFCCGIVYLVINLFSRNLILMNFMHLKWFIQLAGDGICLCFFHLIFVYAEDIL